MLHVIVKLWPGTQAPARDVSDARFQDQLSATLAELTGVSLF